MEEKFFSASREVACKQAKFDFVVAGGGITGVCAAIAAAREGLKVALVQDRPVLGGNGSSEVRVWMLGATSHMGNNNRWSREGGIIDEILIENQFRNKEGNPVIFDTVLIDKVLGESGANASGLFPVWRSRAENRLKPEIRPVNRPERRKNNDRIQKFYPERCAE